MLKVKCNKKGIEKANKIIKQGGIIIFPTDTIYGIGCDPYNKNAVKRIYDIKRRDTSKLLPVLVYSKDIAEKIVVFDNLSRKLAEKFWPGPLTLILDLKDMKLKKSLNIQTKIAVRVPNHNCTLELLRSCNYLVGTSANLSGQLPFTDPIEGLKKIQNYDIFLDGGLITSKGESTIIEVENEKIKIIRQGAIKEREILVK